MKKRFVLKVEKVVYLTEGDWVQKERRVNAWGVYDKKKKDFVVTESGDLVYGEMAKIRDSLNELHRNLKAEGKDIKDVDNESLKVSIEGGKDGEWVWLP